MAMRDFDASFDPPPIGSIPFAIGVTGHRDVHPDDHARVSAAVVDILRLTCAALPATPVLLISALAQGADRIAARALLDLREREPDRFGERLSLCVPLPMRRSAYVEDFSGEIECALNRGNWQSLPPETGAQWRMHAVTEFDELLARIGPNDSFFEIPKNALVAPRTGSWDEPHSAPYALLADYLNVHCHALIAIWDGDERPERRKRGGTADVVLSRLNGFARSSDRKSARSLAPLERSSVIHVPVRRVCDLDPRPAAAIDTHAVPDWLRPRGQQATKIAERPRVSEWVTTPLLAIKQRREHAEWAKTAQRLKYALGPRSGGNAAEWIALGAELWTDGRAIAQFNAAHQAQWILPDYRAEVLRGGSVLQSLPENVALSDGGVVSADPAALASLASDLRALLATQAAASLLAQQQKRIWDLRWLFIAIAAGVAGGSSAMKAVVAALFGPASGEAIEAATFAVVTLIAIGLYLRVTTSPLRNAYLEYRALAEGLRFQAYWLAAGMRELVTNHYVMKLRSELGWVRGAIDATMLLPALRPLSPCTVAWGWIIDQASYVGRPAAPDKAPSTSLVGGQWADAADWMDGGRFPGGRTVALRRRQNATATSMGNRFLVLGACFGVGTLLLVGLGMPPIIVGATGVLMKLLPVIGATVLSLNSKRGHSEFLKQADHLKSVYARAMQTLSELLNDSAISAEERDERVRHLLLALGKESLAENANWLALFMQRKVTWHGK